MRLKIIFLTVFLATLVRAESVENRSQEERYMSYLEAAIQFYFEHCKNLPLSFSDLLTYSDGCDFWSGPYVKQMIEFDSWGEAFVF